MVSGRVTKSLDRVISIDYIEKSASLGEMFSQYNLGNIYRLGEDTAQDFTKAAYWFSLAANLCFAPAQIDLSIINGEGKGVEVDLAESYK